MIKECLYQKLNKCVLVMVVIGMVLTGLFILPSLNVVKAQSCGSSCGCNGSSCGLSSSGCSWDANFGACTGSFVVGCNSGASCNGGAYGGNNNAYCSSTGSFGAGCDASCCGAPPTPNPSGCIPCPNEPWRTCCQALSFTCPNGCDTTTNNHNDGIYRCYENPGTSTEITGCGQVDWLDENGNFAGYSTWNCGAGCQGASSAVPPPAAPSGCKGSCNPQTGSPGCEAAGAGNNWTQYICQPDSPGGSTGQCLNSQCISSVNCICPTATPTPAPCTGQDLIDDRDAKCSQASNAPRICGSNYITDCSNEVYNCGDCYTGADESPPACTTVNNSLCCDPNFPSAPQCYSGAVPAFNRREATTEYCPFTVTNANVACTTNISGTLYDVTEFDNCNLVTNGIGLEAYKITTSSGQINMVSTNVSLPATYTGNANDDGSYSVSGVRVPDTYSLQPSLPPSLGFASEPRCTQSTVSFNVGEHNVARTNVNFGFWRGIPGWFQLKGGNILVEDSVSAYAIQSKVPEKSASAVSYAPRFFMRSSTGAADATAGFAVTGQGSTAILSARKEGQANEYLRQASDVTQKLYAQRTRNATKVFKNNYAYFYRRYSLGSINNGQFPKSVISVNDLDEFEQSTLNSLIALSPVGPPERGAYYVEGNVILTGASWSVPSDQSYVIFVNGDITINSPITVAPGGFFAIIAKGNITFSPSIGTATHSSETPTVEGVFIADKKIIIDTVDAVNHGDLKFIGAGTFVGWEGFTFARDLRTNSTLLENYDWPAELFIERPDFALNAPAKMKKPLYDWNEVSP